MSMHLYPCAGAARGRGRRPQAALDGEPGSEGNSESEEGPVQKPKQARAVAKKGGGRLGGGR